jgi:hypothetical protein
MLSAAEKRQIRQAEMVNCNHDTNYGSQDGWQVTFFLLLIA